MQNFGDNNRSISLLKILQHRDPCSPHCQGRAVQSVHEFRFRSAGTTKTNVAATRLVAFIIRARRNFAKRILRWQPNLDIVGFRAAETEITG